MGHILVATSCNYKISLQTEFYIQVMEVYYRVQVRGQASQRDLGQKYSNSSGKRAKFRAHQINSTSHFTYSVLQDNHSLAEIMLLVTCT